jgi:hypothetical protein
LALSAGFATAAPAGQHAPMVTGLQHGGCVHVRQAARRWPPRFIKRFMQRHAQAPSVMTSTAMIAMDRISPKRRAMFVLLFLKWL